MTLEGEEPVDQFIKSLEHIKILPSLASYSTSLAYPAKISHRSMSKEQRESMGITDDLIRVSAGLENFEDLKKEFSKALKNL